MAERADHGSTPVPADTDPKSAGRVGPADRLGWRLADRHWRVEHLPLLVTASGVLLLLAALVGAVTAGAAGAVGAAAGVFLVAGSQVLTTLVVAWADSVHPRLVLPFGLGMYTVKISLIGGLVAALAGAGWAGLLPLIFGIVAGVAGWTGVHIWWVSTVHAPRVGSTPGGEMLDPGSAPGGEMPDPDPGPGRGGGAPRALGLARTRPES